MRGLVLAEVGRVAVRDDLPEPQLLAPTDAVVRVRRAGLCGSDLHPYSGREPARLGVVQGHELVGEVVAVGSEVASHGVGDRVLAAFSTSCGRCAACRRGLSARCEHSWLFGWGPPSPQDGDALEGAQAELVRVPQAEHTLVGVPAGISDTDAVLLTDNLPTAWYALQRAAVAPGEPVVVVGLGSVGLCAVVCAPLLGVGEVIAVDLVADRRDRAAALGATAVTPEAAPEVLRAAAPDGAPAVVEAAGVPAAQRLAFDLLRPGGTLSIIAVQTTAEFPFTPVEAYDRNLTVRAGRAPVRSLLDDLLPRLAAGEVPIPPVITHPDVALEDGPELYRRFAAREPGLVKAVFAP